MNFSLKILISTFLTVLSFLLYTYNIDAQEIIFQDEFDATRSANVLDDTKWIVNKNNPYTWEVIKENNGYVNLSTGNWRMFPYVLSKQNPFPTSGNFELEFSIKYSSVVQRGNGLVISLVAPINGSSELDKDKPEVYFFGVWQGTDEGFNITYNGFCAIGLPCNQPGKILLHTAAPNLNQYDIKLTYLNNMYTLYANDIRIFTSPLTSTRPTSIWFGNPADQVSYAPWTSFRVNYIRVKSFPNEFLDLPFDYGNQDFDDVVYNPSSWFDHHYPTQTLKCCENMNVLKFTGEESNQGYRTHNGYDYPLKLNTPVLAAADGLATFVPESESGGAGNVIKIDHGNGYQTWYQHLSNNNLIIRTIGTSQAVLKGDNIGEVGLTGNITGPHIHFSVFKDTNGTGFSDDKPVGVNDPLGWDGNYPDPWTLWTNSTGRHGAQSTKLYTKLAPPKTITADTSGGALTSGHTTVFVPPQALDGQTNITYTNGPYEKISQNIKSILPSFFLEAVSWGGTPLVNFNFPISISYDFSKADLSNINPDAIKFYYLNQITGVWEELSTSINNMVATTSVNHLSRFTLAGELLDYLPPITAYQILSGTKGLGDWYTSDVTIGLEASDQGNAGVDSTIYSLKDGDGWEIYQNPLTFTEEGSYSILYKSFDKADNYEGDNKFEFTIDKPPTITLSSDTEEIWPPDGRIVNVIITGTVSDPHLAFYKLIVDDEYNTFSREYTFPITEFTQIIPLEARRKGEDLDGRHYTITLEAYDEAGNKGEQSVTITVPHDQED